MTPRDEQKRDGQAPAHNADTAGRDPGASAKHPPFVYGNTVRECIVDFGAGKVKRYPPGMVDVVFPTAEGIRLQKEGAVEGLYAKGDITPPA